MGTGGNLPANHVWWHRRDFFWFNGQWGRGYPALKAMGTSRVSIHGESQRLVTHGIAPPWWLSAGQLSPSRCLPQRSKMALGPEHLGFANLKMATEIVDLPFEHAGSFHREKRLVPMISWDPCALWPARTKWQRLQGSILRGSRCPRRAFPNQPPEHIPHQRLWSGWWLTYPCEKRWSE